MGKRFEITPAARKRIDQALARLDAAKARQRKAKMKAAADKRRRREREKAQARATIGAGGVRGVSNAHRARYGLAGWKVLAARMRDGEWYGFGQVKILMAEFPVKSVKAWLWQKAISQGVVVKAGNPDWKPSDNPTVHGERYLYALSTASKADVEQWRGELGIEHALSAPQLAQDAR